MGAGDSLEQMRQRRLTSAEAKASEADRLRERARELDHQVVNQRRRAENEAKGRTGELAVAAQLDTLRTSGWYVLHDRQLPGSRANIDHIAVGPGGIFVIDAKAWSGTAVVRNDELRVGGFRRVDELDKATRYARTVAASVRSALPGLTGLPSYPVLCFAEPVGIPAPTSVRGVTLVELPSLIASMAALPPVLSPRQAWDVGEAIERLHPPRSAPSMAAQAAVDRRPPRRERPARVEQARPARPRRREVPPRRTRSTSSLAAPLLRLALVLLMVLVGVKVIPLAAPAIARMLTSQLVHSTSTVHPTPTRTPAPSVSPTRH